MECVEGFLDGKVCDAVHKRIEEDKIARKAKVDELREKAAKCSHEGCNKFVQVHSKGVCRENGAKFSHEGYSKPVHSKGVCREHGPRCSHEGCSKLVYSKSF